MSSSSLPTVIGYSERGLVYGLVHELRQDLDRVGEFLRIIQWNGAGTAAGVDALANSIQNHSVSILLEPSFAQFGEPDLVIVCRRSDEAPHIFFFEAKIIPYIFSAMSWRGRGMRQRGFNSSINGQLSLRYRLIQALLNHRASASTLVEPAAQHEAYRANLGDENGKRNGKRNAGKESVSPAWQPRSLAKHPVIKLLVEGVMCAPKLTADRTYIVAITDDPKSPFEDPVNMPAIRRSSRDSRSGDWSPQYLKKGPSHAGDVRRDIGAWERTGWLGWRDPDGKKPTWFVKKTSNEWALALPSDPPLIKKKYRTLAMGRRAWPTHPAVTAMRNRFATVAANHGMTYAARKGSDSVIYDGVVIAKLLPPDGSQKGPSMTLGLAAGYLKKERGYKLCVINGRVFRCKDLVVDAASAEKIKAALGPFLDELQ